MNTRLPIGSFESTPILDSTRKAAQPTHTPTPWETQPYDPCSIVSTKTKYRIELATTYGDNAEATANAAFIVKAVNSYERLVAALRLAEPIVASAQLDDEDRGRSAASAICLEALGVVRDALAEVEK